MNLGQSAASNDALQIGFYYGASSSASNYAWMGVVGGYPTHDIEVNGNGLVTVPSLADTALTSGDCVQGGSGGLLGSAANPCGATTAAATFASSGGAGPGATFNGATAVTVDYHTVGAAAAPLNWVNVTSSFSIAAGTGYYANCSSACTGTLPATITTGFGAAVVSIGTTAVTIASGGPNLHRRYDFAAGRRHLAEHRRLDLPVDLAGDDVRRGPDVYAVIRGQLARRGKPGGFRIGHLHDGDLGRLHGDRRHVGFALQLRANQLDRGADHSARLRFSQGGGSGHHQPRGDSCQRRDCRHCLHSELSERQTMKKKIISVLGLILIAMASRAQTAVTATVVDSDGTAWANGTWSAEYAGVPNYSAAVLNALTGQWISPNPVTGSLNGSGALSVNLVPTQYVFGPSRAAGNSPGVIFTVCPQIRGGACYQTAPIVISGSSQSVGAQINAVIQAPRVFGLSATAEAYADAEVSALAGNMYLNLTSGTLRCYTSSWAACSSGGSGSVTSVALVGSGNLFNTSAGTAVTGAGTLNVDSQLLTQLANCLVAGPATGANAAPACRALVNADFPNTLAPTISLANMTGLLSAQVTAALGYTPANCTAGTTGNDCLQLSGGLVPVLNLPQGSSSAAGALQCGSGTTCSGGSISVGASGGCMTPIVVTLGSAASSITISSIPATCQDLIVSFEGSVASSTQSLEIQINGDTTAGDYGIAGISYIARQVGHSLGRVLFLMWIINARQHSARVALRWWHRDTPERRSIRISHGNRSGVRDHPAPLSTMARLDIGIRLPQSPRSSSSTAAVSIFRLAARFM